MVKDGLGGLLGDTDHQVTAISFPCILEVHAFTRLYATLELLDIEGNKEANRQQLP